MKRNITTLNSSSGQLHCCLSSYNSQPTQIHDKKNTKQQITIDTSRNRSITNGYLKTPNKPNDKQKIVLKVKNENTNPLKTNTSLNNNRSRSNSKAIPSQQKKNVNTTQNQNIAKPIVKSIFSLFYTFSLENIKPFSKLGKVKIDLNNTNSKSSTQNLMTSKKSLDNSASIQSVNNNCPKDNKLQKQRSTSQQKSFKPLSKNNSQIPCLFPISILLLVTKTQSNQDVFSAILPDFANFEGEKRKTTDSSNFSMKKEDIAASEILLDLPEINYDHLKEMTAFTVQELQRDRLALAQKVAYTFRVKKRIPATTPEYYRVNTFILVQNNDRQLCYVIGRGAFAKVCLAVQVLTGQLVAMKIIEKSSLKSENSKKRIVQEVMILKGFSSYGQIIKLHEVFETKKQIFIIMEYVQGGDLMKFTKENGHKLEESQAKQIFIQLVQTFQIMQNHNVLHRDIKLDNVLINQNKQIKVCDFGVSKLVVKGQKIMDQCGTPAYLAPEIISCRGGYEGFQSDIWSLGVVLYLMVIGKVPFKGNSMNELNQSIQSGMLNFMEIKNAGISNECIDIIKKMLTINPKQRISLQELVNHDWIKNDGNLHKGLKQINEIHLTLKKSQFTLDSRIIAQIEALGYQREYIHKCLQKQGLCHINALYQVLCKS